MHTRNKGVGVRKKIFSNFSAYPKPGPIVHLVKVAVCQSRSRGVRLPAPPRKLCGKLVIN